MSDCGTRIFRHIGLDDGLHRLSNLLTVCGVSYLTVNVLLGHCRPLFGPGSAVVRCLCVCVCVCVCLFIQTFGNKMLTQIFGIIYIRHSGSC